MNILAIFAHPDDESYGPGAYLARQAAEGHSVFLLTMTRGESGSLGKSRELSRDELAKIRTAEVRRAAKVLGVLENTTLNFPDKGLTDSPAEKVISKIQKYIQKYNPGEIVTFHPNGISGHPDHRALTRLIISLYPGLKPGVKLLHYGLSENQANTVRHRHLRAIPESEIDLRIDVSGFVDRKIEAIKCHESQLALWNEFNSLSIPYREFSGIEYFSEYKPSFRGNDEKR